MTVLRSPRSGTFNDWLSTLPTGPLVALAGVVLAVIVVLSVIVMEFVGTKTDNGALGIAAGIVGGCLGGGWGFFRTKRQTWQPDLTPVPMPGESLDPTDAPFEPADGKPYHVVPAQHVGQYMEATAPSRPSGAIAPAGDRPAYLPQTEGSGDE